LSGYIYKPPGGIIPRTVVTVALLDNDAGYMAEIYYLTDPE
jgi:hypothetical protein